MSTADKPLNQPLYTHTHTCKTQSQSQSQSTIPLTHSKEWDPQQCRVEFPVWYKEDPCSCHIGDADSKDAQEAQERLPPEAVPHGAGYGGSQEHQHQTDQHFSLGQHAGLVEVPPQAEGGEWLDVELVGRVRCLSCGQPANQSTELILPVFCDDILHHRSMVTEVVGDLDSTSELDLLVSTVGQEGHAAQLVADEGHTAILWRTLDLEISEISWFEKYSLHFNI